MKLHLYHTNDIHSNFGALASLATYIKAHKSEHDLLLDAGDFHDFKHSTINGTNGVGGKEILRHLGYDAICVGNNEGFAGLESLDHMTRDSLPLLSCNLSTIKGTPVYGILPYTILNKQGLRILIIGITPYFGKDGQDTYNVFFHMDHLHVSSPFPIIEAILKERKPDYDISICLSHLGFEWDKHMAEQLTGIDVIIGGHSHTYLAAPIKINQTIISTANEYGNYLGLLTLDIEEGNIIRYEGRIIANTFTQDTATLGVIEAQHDIAIANLSKPLYDLETSLSYSITKENDLINFLCDALALEYPCDFAMINHGIAEHGIGDFVSKMKLLELSPSPLNPTRVNLSGQQIKEAIRQSLEEEHCLLPGRGPGFRGKHIGAIGVSRAITVTTMPFAITFHNAPLVEDAYYDVITSDYLQRGSGYPCLATTQLEYYGGYMRDVLERQLNNEGLLARCKQKRFTYGSEPTL